MDLGFTQIVYKTREPLASLNLDKKNRKRDVLANERTREFLSAVREMHQENKDARELSRIVIERNSVEATKNTSALGEVTQALKDLLRHRPG